MVDYADKNYLQKEQKKKKGFFKWIAGAVAIGALFSWMTAKKPEIKQEQAGIHHAVQATELNEREKKERYVSIMDGLKRVSAFTSGACKKDWSNASSYQITESDYIFEHRILETLADIMKKIVENGPKLNSEQKKGIRIELQAIGQEIDKMSRLGLAPQVHGHMKGGNYVFTPKNTSSALQMIDTCVQNLK